MAEQEGNIMTARQETLSLIHDMNARGIALDFEHANELRRAQITLHRWAEGECGSSNDYASWMIERDEQTGIPYRVTHWNNSRSSDRTRIADREAGALRRVKDICQAASLHYYHQTDPRGCALYVAAEPLSDNNYSSRGVACIGA